MHKYLNSPEDYLRQYRHVPPPPPSCSSSSPHRGPRLTDHRRHHYCPVPHLRCVAGHRHHHRQRHSCTLTTTRTTTCSRTLTPTPTPARTRSNTPMLHILPIARISLSTVPRCKLHHPIHCIVLFVASPCLLCHLPEVLHTLIYCITAGRLIHRIYCTPYPLYHLVDYITPCPSLCH